MEKQMLKAKPIVENKFWILENDTGERIGTVSAAKDRVSYRVGNTSEDFPSFAEMQRLKNVTISTKRNRDPKPTTKTTDVYGYPTNHSAYNQIWNVQHKLPLYTKTAKSSSYHCAGYYIIKFDKIWCKSSSPKLITLQRYQFLGPFKNKIDQAATLRKCLEEA